MGTTPLGVTTEGVAALLLRALGPPSDAARVTLAIERASERRRVRSPVLAVFIVDSDSTELEADDAVDLPTPEDRTCDALDPPLLLIVRRSDCCLDIAVPNGGDCEKAWNDAEVLGRAGDTPS